MRQASEATIVAWLIAYWPPVTTYVVHIASESQNPLLGGSTLMVRWVRSDSCTVDLSVAPATLCQSSAGQLPVECYKRLSKLLTRALVGAEPGLTCERDWSHGVGCTRRTICRLKNSPPQAPIHLHFFDYGTVCQRHLPDFPRGQPSACPGG